VNFATFFPARDFSGLAVDISDNDVRKVVESIADWLEQTGGLYVM
jgi:hypothetical protein